MRPHSGRGRTPLSGVLICTLALNAFDFVLTTSALIAMSTPSCRDTPRLTVSAHGFTMLSSTMAMFGGAVEANDAGERPPYGSGEVGLLTLIAVYRSVASSAPGGQ